MPDLSKTEKENVRLALRFLMVGCGGWKPLASVLGVARQSLSNINSDDKASISASLALRAARLAMVPLEDVLTGKYPPPGMCPTCGHQRTENETTTNQMETT